MYIMRFLFHALSNSISPQIDDCYQENKLISNITEVNLFIKLILLTFNKKCD